MECACDVEGNGCRDFRAVSRSKRSEMVGRGRGSVFRGSQQSSIEGEVLIEELVHQVFVQVVSSLAFLEEGEVLIEERVHQVFVQVVSSLAFLEEVEGGVMVEECVHQVLVQIFR